MREVLGSNPGPVKSDTSVGSGSPPLRRFFGAVLSMRGVAEMSLATRYTLRRNTASIMKTWRKNKATVNLKTGRFDSVDSAVINSGVCKAVLNCKYTTKQCKTALHTLLMITAESMLSKPAVLRFTATLFFFLKLFSSHIYCIMKI